MKLGLVTFILIVSSSILAIEVSGHISEDTIWSHENNPYNVVDNIFVDSGITLTILPGTQIYIHSAPLTSLDDWSDYFWFNSGNNEAKMFWINGKINAIGSEQDSILFTRLTYEEDHYWGNIYITDNADKSTFKHCKFEYSGGQGIYVGLVAWSLITFHNKQFEMESCHLKNYIAGIAGNRYQWFESISITETYFEIDSNMSEFVTNRYKEHLLINTPIDGYPSPLIAGNRFTGNYRIEITQSHFIQNTLSNNNSAGVLMGGHERTTYVFKNDFYNYQHGIDSHGVLGDSIYIKENRFVGGNEAIDLDYFYFEIVDNYFEDCGVNAIQSTTSIIQNNIFDNPTGLALGCYTDVAMNNVFTNCYRAISGGGRTIFSNNLFINNNDVFSSLTETLIYENMILIGNIDLVNNQIYGNPIFRNCILDSELPEECIDGGGNIWVDSLQAQQIFEDIENGDFHLTNGSLAIDAGFDTLDYYYPFDMEYNHRVWDGDNDGSAIIDIGPYEYNSPSWGGIEGYTYNPTTGDLVNYVLLKINNVSREFTFSDSIGNFEFRLPAGIYDVYAERIYYDDVIEYQVVVIDGQSTFIEIPMYETVSSEDFEQTPFTDEIIITIYPNPFNPSTTLEFNLLYDSDVDLSVYNIKGQRVLTLIDEQLVKGEHSVLWGCLDTSGNPVSSGIYFTILKVGDVESCSKMMLLK